jgi:signal transduction histidine kinase
MRGRLRWRILATTTLPLIVLVVTALWLVQRSVSDHVHDNIEQDLLRASAVFEDMLAARTDQLGKESQVIVQDPKFFSMLLVAESHHDPEYRNTIARLAQDFNAITEADLLEIWDGDTLSLASVGPQSSVDVGQKELVESALAGRLTTGLLVSSSRQLQAVATPVVVGGRVVGVLLLALDIGQELADRLRSRTRSEVSFVADHAITGSTLVGGDDRTALLDGLGKVSGELGGASGGSLLFAARGPRETYQVLARPLPNTPGNARRVYTLQRSLDAETRHLRSLTTGLIQLGTAAVMFTLLAGIFVSMRITGPIEGLVRAAEEIGRGNYEYPLMVQGTDEIGVLATRFQEMRLRERAYVRSLEEVAQMKSDFISVTSHELRTPISIISGFHELMAEESMGPLNDQQKRALTAIGQGVSTLHRIAQDATRIAQIESERLVLNRGSTDLGTVVSQAIEGAQGDARGRSVTVSREIDGAVPRLFVDGPRLAEAIGNLVRNGIRFTPDGGTVRLSAVRRHDSVVIEVQDSGIGISPDRVRAIFDKTILTGDVLHHHSSPTLEFNSSGLGLGLRIARGIIEAHRGTIRAESEVGRGSRFIVEIPMSAMTESLAA